MSSNSQVKISDILKDRFVEFKAKVLNAPKKKFQLCACVSLGVNLVLLIILICIASSYSNLCSKYENVSRTAQAIANTSGISSDMVDDSLGRVNFYANEQKDKLKWKLENEAKEGLLDYMDSTGCALDSIHWDECLAFQSRVIIYDTLETIMERYESGIRSQLLPVPENGSVNGSDSIVDFQAEFDKSIVYLRGCTNLVWGKCLKRCHVPKNVAKRRKK